MFRKTEQLQVHNLVSCKSLACRVQEQLQDIRCPNLFFFAGKSRQLHDLFKSVGANCILERKNHSAVDMCFPVIETFID